MASDQPQIVLDGVAYPLVSPDDMTMGEQRMFERIADAGVDKLELLQTDYRAGLIVAWMAVSVKRERPSTPVEQITKRLDDLKPGDLADVWAAVVENPPETAETPPSSTGNDDSEKQTGPSSATRSGSTPGTPTPKRSGPRLSATGATSGSTT